MRDHIMCNYDDRIVMRGTILERIVTASWDSKCRKYKGKMDVFRIDENENVKVRNIDFYPISGYMFVSPKSLIQRWAEPCINMDDFRFHRTHTLTDEEKLIILKAYPDFKWTLEKANKHITLSLAYAFRLLLAWKRNHKVELLVDAGLFYLAMNKAFAKMSYDKQKDVVRFIRDKLNGRDEHLSKVMTMMNRNLTEEQYKTWTNFRPDGNVVKYDEYLYFKKIKFKNEWDLVQFVRLYNDYAFMAKKAGHNMKDPYWLYPKDLNTMHDRVMKECKLIDEARRIAAEKAAKEREMKKKSLYEKIARKWVDKNIKVGSIEVFVPADVSTISKQAEVLHQCLIGCDYTQKVIDKKCLLVFITKKGKPYATAEIMPNGTVGQFYSDERKRNIKPDASATAALNEWIATYKPKFRTTKQEAA